jgi:ABC-2 type transport system ATP-binding protein
MGQKKLTIDLHEKTEVIPEGLKNYDLELSKDKLSITYIYDVNERTGITNLLQDLRDNGLKLRDLKTEQSTLEKIFVNLVKESNEN